VGAPAVDYKVRESLILVELFFSNHHSKLSFDELKASDRSGCCEMATFEKGKACNNKSISGAQQSPLSIKFAFFLKECAGAARARIVYFFKSG